MPQFFCAGCIQMRIPRVIVEAAAAALLMSNVNQEKPHVFRSLFPFS